MTVNKTVLVAKIDSWYFSVNMVKVFTLLFVTISIFASAQGIFTMGKMQGHECPTAIDAQMNSHIPVNSGFIASIAYNYLDKIYQQNSGHSYKTYMWDMNWNYSNLDSGLRKVTLAIDTVVDAYTEQDFSIGFMILDSIYIAYGHVNNSGKPDTLIINLVRLYSGTVVAVNTSS